MNKKYVHDSSARAYSQLEIAQLRLVVRQAQDDDALQARQLQHLTLDEAIDDRLRNELAVVQRLLHSQLIGEVVADSGLEYFARQMSNTVSNIQSNLSSQLSVH